VVWIAFLAVLLTGVVALNVAVLRLNMRLDELAQTRADLRADNAALQARISSESTLTRVETLARRRLGLRPAEPAETGYVHLDR
jgi:cell division protein FtsL